MFLCWPLPGFAFDQKLCYMMINLANIQLLCFNIIESIYVNYICLCHLTLVFVSYIYVITSQVWNELNISFNSVFFEICFCFETLQVNIYSLLDWAVFSKASLSISNLGTMSNSCIDRLNFMSLQSTSLNFIQLDIVLTILSN